MYISKSQRLGLTVHFIIFSALCISISQAFSEFSLQYIKSIRENDEMDRAGGEYNYDMNGEDWQGTCATGTRQTPIDLKSAQITTIPQIQFHNFNLALQTPVYVVNNGHSASVVVPSTLLGQQPYISGGMLPGNFQVESVHFHWGSENHPGSEHAINSKHFDAEMHIVCKNAMYETVGDASQHPNGLAVLGVMINAVPKQPLLNTGLNKVLNQLSSVTAFNSNTSVLGHLTTNDFLAGIVTDEFYTYNGSLTTPDCAEAVTWTVFNNPIDVPIRHVSKFWDLLDPRGIPLINNYRILQDINNRTIYYRKVK